MEVWKEVVGYEGLYQVSNYGNLKNVKRGTLKSLNGLNKGYIKTILHNGGNKKYTVIHRIVAKAFIPNPHNKPEVNHKDGNKLNNHVDNLEWATCKENIRHAYANGLIKNAGRPRKDSVLTEKDVIAIRRLSVVKTIKELAKAFKISTSQTHRIIKGESWRILYGEE